MAAISVTPASVKPQSNSPPKVVIWGEAVTAGQIVYELTPGVYWLAQADGTAAQATAKGMAMTSGAADQYGVIVEGGIVNVGGTVVAGTEYWLHTGAGGFGVESEISSSGHYKHKIGQATTTGRINLNFQNTFVTI